MTMQKLRALQQAKKTESTPDKKEDEVSTSSNGTSDSKKPAATGSVFSLKSKAKSKGKTQRANAAQLRAQKGEFYTKCLSFTSCVVFASTLFSNIASCSITCCLSIDFLHVFFVLGFDAQGIC